MIDSLLRTPLHDIHVKMGARMVEFAGWSMPIAFAGINREHLHTRSACSVFDVSHMGRLSLAGDDCEAFLNRVCTRNLAGAQGGRSYYSHICREDGGILDDVIVSRFDDHWGIVCNGANREKIVAWLRDRAAGTDVVVRDETMSTGMLAIQGPKTLTLVEELAGVDLSKLKRYRFMVREYLGLRIIIYRSGYTGEDGLEIVFPASAATMLLPYLLGTGEAPHPVIKPAGLGARDTLRIEAAMPLYGHELTEEVDPLTAGQEWCVDLAKDFVGAGAMRTMKQRGVPRRLVGLQLEGRRIARQHYRVFAGEQTVGSVTSGTLSPTLGKSIAMALVESRYRSEGTALEVELSGKRVPAVVVQLPFYKRNA